MPQNAHWQEYDDTDNNAFGAPEGAGNNNIAGKSEYQ
jgi:hypothetical protein